MVGSRVAVFSMLVLLLCLSTAIAHAQGAEAGALKVGIAAVDITPTESVYMQGFSGRDKNPSTGVYKEIEASCVVFDNGVTRVGLMAIDVCKTDVSQVAKVREVAEKLSIPPQHMMINSSHSHCGPKVMGNQNPDYVPIFEERICGLLQTAVDDLQEATLDYTVGLSTMAVNRRQLNEEGKYIGMRPEPRKPIDPEVPVLRVLSPDGQVRAVIFGYACHPTTMGGYEIGPDFVGYARDWIEAAYPGAMAMFIQGCGGDIKPRYSLPSGRFGYVLLEAKETVAEVGHELGRAVIAATAVPPSPLGTYLGGRSGMAGIPTVKQVEDTPQGGLFPIEVQVLRIGDVYIVGLNGEILVEIGLHIKRELADLKMWVNGYCNRDLSYIANAAAWDEGGYEITAGWTTAEAEDILVAKAVELTRELASTH